MSVQSVRLVRVACACVHGRAPARTHTHTRARARAHTHARTHARHRPSRGKPRRLSSSDSIPLTVFRCLVAGWSRAASQCPQDGGDVAVLPSAGAGCPGSSRLHGLRQLRTHVHTGHPIAGCPSERHLRRQPVSGDQSAVQNQRLRGQVVQQASGSHKTR